MDTTIFAALLLGASTACMAAVPMCEDLNTAACSLFLASKPDLCTDPTLSINCKRFCGQCPLVCYDCPNAVNTSTDCTNAVACQPDEYCIQRTHSYLDGTKEYIMGCEKKVTCDGENIGFHNLIGRRDINFHCCDSDLCNLPAEFRTTPTPPTTTTVPTTPHITLSPLNNCSRDIVFILDGSSTIGSSNHYQMRSFVQTVLHSMPIGTMDSLVAMVEYSDTARVEWYLTDHMTYSDLLSATNNIPYVTGSTATHAAFWLTRNSVLTSQHGDRPNADDVIIVITDGGTDLPGMAISEAKKLHDQGVEIITIGVGSHVDDHELSQIKSNYSYNVSSFSQLRTIVDAVKRNLCT